MSRFAFIGFAALALPLSAQVQQPVPPVEFNRDVRPILSGNCFTCHGQGEGSRKGCLRLVDLTNALTGGKTGLPAIVPGKPDETALLPPPCASPFAARHRFHPRLHREASPTSIINICRDPSPAMPGTTIASPVRFQHGAGSRRRSPVAQCAMKIGGARSVRPVRRSRNV
jgi:hypothetical protein